MQELERSTPKPRNVKIRHKCMYPHTLGKRLKPRLCNRTDTIKTSFVTGKTASPVYFCRIHAQEWDNVLREITGKEEPLNAISVKSSAKKVSRRPKPKKARKEMGQGNKEDEKGVQRSAKQSKKKKVHIQKQRKAKSKKITKEKVS